MRRKVVAGMLTFAMFGMSLSSFSPTQVCAADDLGKVEDRKSTRLNSSHSDRSRMPSSA